MESDLFPRRRAGWPVTYLLAFIPAILALGFVAGMGIATYGRAPLAAAPAAAPAAGNASVDSATDQSWRILTQPPQSPVVSAPPSLPFPTQTTRTNPAQVYFTGPAKDIREARLALATDYGQYLLENQTEIRFDYQQMRQAASGTSLVGMISVSDYEAWTQALGQDPVRLKKWLEAAAGRVQAAATKDRFHLSWAVVDVMRDRPLGFADSEVIALDNRSFLVIRPLASTVDHTKTEIAIRSLSSLSEAGRTGATETAAPWLSYGPVIRFDETDLYRPLRAMEAKPLSRP